MKCLSCAFATEENPFHSAASPLQADPGLKVDGALFKSEGHLLGLAGRFGLMKYVLPSGRAGRPRRSLNQKGVRNGEGRSPLGGRNSRRTAGFWLKVMTLFPASSVACCSKCTKHSVSGCLAICTDCFFLCIT